jgi:hypothetical protein
MTDTSEVPKKNGKKPFMGTGCMVSILAILGLLIFLASRMPQCGKSSKQATMARSLSQERLARLYQLMRELRESPVDDGSRFAGYSGDTIPSEFRDLKCKRVRPSDFSPNIMLEGCFDHYLYLKFYGIGKSKESGDHSPRITLQYGEFEIVEEVLWRPERDKETEQ